MGTFISRFARFLKTTTTTKRMTAVPDAHANNAKLLSFLFALLALIVLLLAANKDDTHDERCRK